MSITNRASISAVMATFDGTGTKLPKVIVDIQTRSQRLVAGVEKMQATRSPGIAQAVAEAILSDSDPYTDKTVLSAVVASHVNSDAMQRHMQESADEHLVQAFREHADVIVQAWRKPFDAAAADLTEAHDRLGDLELDDSTAILKLGGDIATAWSQARTAVATIEKIVQGWALLGMATNLDSSNRRTKLLRFADVTPERFATEFDQQTVTTWQAVCAGLTLSLPTFGEMAARTRAVEVYRQAKSDDAMKPARRQSLLSGSSA